MTNPKHVANWWGPRGSTTTIAEMDFRVGGEGKHVMRGPDGTKILGWSWIGGCRNPMLPSPGKTKAHCMITETLNPRRHATSLATGRRHSVADFFHPDRLVNYLSSDGREGQRN